MPFGELHVRKFIRRMRELCDWTIHKTDRVLNSPLGGIFSSYITKERLRDFYEFKNNKFLIKTIRNIKTTFSGIKIHAEPFYVIEKILNSFWDPGTPLVIFPMKRMGKNLTEWHSKLDGNEIMSGKVFLTPIVGEICLTLFNMKIARDNFDISISDWHLKLKCSSR